MILFIIGVLAAAGAGFLLFAEKRGMYFRLFNRYYFTPRIGERMHIVKTGYDEKGQIAILEGVGLEKSYALPCVYLPQGSAAGAEEVFVYRQKFPTTQNVYRYSSMETELLAAGRDVDNSVSVVKGATRISSDGQWRSVNLLVHTLSLLTYGCLALSGITFIIFLLTGGTASAVALMVFGILALVLKLLYKAERHGPALRIYSDVAPAKEPEPAVVQAAERVGLDENERRAFLREQERRDMFEKMNPRFNEFYGELKTLVEDPNVPPMRTQVLSAAVAEEMNRVCFAPTAHPQTKAEAMARMKAMEASTVDAKPEPPSAPEPPRAPKRAAGGPGSVDRPSDVQKLQEPPGDAPVAPEEPTAPHGDSEPAWMREDSQATPGPVQDATEQPQESEAPDALDAPGEDGTPAEPAPDVVTEDAEGPTVAYAHAGDGEVIEVEEVDEDQLAQVRGTNSEYAVDPIIIDDVVESDVTEEPQPVENSQATQGRSRDAGRSSSGRAPSEDDFTSVLRGDKIICTTCGIICDAPAMRNWQKTKCPECGATIRKPKEKPNT